MVATAASAGEMQVAVSTTCTVELQVAVQQRSYCGTVGGGDSAGDSSREGGATVKKGYSGAADGAAVKKNYNGAARGAAVKKNYSGAVGGATAEKM